MHTPQVLFLDEPTLGLDPQTRRKIWNYIRGLKNSYGMTIILTTHYMEEADKLCSRVAVIDEGLIVALDTPQALKARLGGEVLELETSNAREEFVSQLKDQAEVASVATQNGRIPLGVKNGETFVPKVFELSHKHGVDIFNVSMRKPNLEDVFIKLTGREIREDTIKEPSERIRIFMQRRRR
jgi:ABC-2 type transport system ATP-binding protein